MLLLMQLISFSGIRIRVSVKWFNQRSVLSSICRTYCVISKQPVWCNGRRDIARCIWNSEMLGWANCVMCMDCLTVWEMNGWLDDCLDTGLFLFIEYFITNCNKSEGDTLHVT